ncbi:MAG: hypothetical protein B7Y49_08790 [Sphingomonas sp. 28-62-11]|nr:MAG: hypothetical protein B7Y49_08790 [Sphingomonas sp. 28-62-11]
MARQPYRSWGRAMSTWAATPPARRASSDRATFPAASKSAAGLVDRIGTVRCNVMARIPIFVALILFAVPAVAADRNYSIGSFERIRIEGPYEVKLATGKPPSGRATGDERALDTLTLTVEGQTLIVRARPLAVGENPPSPKIPLVVTLSTPVLRSANVNGGGRLAVARMAGQRLDVAVNGAGAITVQGLEGDQLVATVIGAGTMTLAGRAGRARFQLSGPGTIDASSLVTNDLIARSEGNGELRLNARYTADVTSSGLGAIVVVGKPACKVKSAGGGPISCGSQ